MKRRRSLIGLLIVGAVLMAAGCASTEELYADYDTDACLYALESVADGRTLVREKTTRRSTWWETAVYFDYNEHTLTDDAREHLDHDLYVLTMFPDLRLVVRGSADSRGSDEYNLRLADRRIAAVIDYFTAKGVDESRFESLAVGESLPILKSDSEPGHAINRRVELILIDEQGRPLRYELQLESITSRDIIQVSSDAPVAAQ